MYMYMHATVAFGGSGASYLSFCTHIDPGAVYRRTGPAQTQDKAGVDVGGATV